MQRILLTNVDIIDVDIVGEVDSLCSRHVVSGINTFSFSAKYSKSQDKLISVNEELYGCGADLEYDILSYLDPTGSCCIYASIVANGKIIREVCA